MGNFATKLLPSAAEGGIIFKLLYYEAVLPFSPEPERSVKQPVKVAEPEESSASIEDFIQDVMQGGAEEDPDATKRVPDLSGALDDTKIWTEEDEETTPRPKFNFDDLQFGKNVNKN